MSSFLHSFGQSLWRFYDYKHVDWKHLKVELEDKSECCIQYIGDENAEIVLLLFPSLTGSADQFWHFADLVKDFKDKRFSIVVLNKRATHCPLKTRRWDLFGDIKETHALVDLARSLHPSGLEAYAVGYSGGGLSLARYLESDLAQKSETGKWITNAAIVSTPLHKEMFEVVPNWMYLHLRYRVISMYFLPYLGVWKKPGECVLYRLLVGGMDDLAKWASEQEGKNWNQAVDLKKIQIPLFIMQAKDDVIWGWKDEWKESCTPVKGKFELHETGGHLGFYTGHFWNAKSTIEEQVFEWFSQ